jgi:hypothetical protein
MGRSRQREANRAFKEAAEVMADLVKNDLAKNHLAKK